MNTLLREQGYIEIPCGAGMPSWQTIREQSLRKGEETTEREPTMLERGVATAASFGLTIRWIGRVFEAVGLEEMVKDPAPVGIVKASDEQVDFAASTAYRTCDRESRPASGSTSRSATPRGRFPGRGTRTSGRTHRTARRRRSPWQRTGLRGHRACRRVLRGTEGRPCRRCDDDPQRLELLPLGAGTRGAVRVARRAVEPQVLWHRHCRRSQVETEYEDQETDLSGAHLLDIAPTILSASTCREAIRWTADRWISSRPPRRCPTRNTRRTISCCGTGGPKLPRRSGVSRIAHDSVTRGTLYRPFVDRPNPIARIDGADPK